MDPNDQNPVGPVDQGGQTPPVEDQGTPGGDQPQTPPSEEGGEGDNIVPPPPISSGDAPEAPQQPSEEPVGGSEQPQS